MPIVKTSGIILKVYDFSETSQIAAVYTEQMGRVQIIAKGAKRPKSPFLGALEPLTLNSLTFIVRKSSTLYTLTDRVLDNAFRPVRTSLAKLYPACATTELLFAIAPEAVANRALFSLFSETLHLLAEKGNERTVLAAFILKTLAIEGFAIEFSRCAICGKTDFRDGRTSLSLQSGGIVCNSCRKESLYGISCPEGARQSFVELSSIPLREAAGIKVEHKLYLDIKLCLNYYIKSVLDRGLRVLNESKGLGYI